MAIAIALGLLLGIWGGRLIVRPIEEVRAFAARLGRRDYGARVAERGAPEIRQMLRDMNALATVLRDRDERLVERTVSMAELRDPRETAAHVKRVSGVSGEIFDGWVARHPEAAGVAAFDRDRLVAAALMHDIGKVGVPDGVLKKPGKLDDAEYICMKRHTVLGASRLLDQDPFDDAARDVVLHHQERWDGRGYPGAVDAATLALDAESLLGLPMDRPGLAGTDIPLFARIVAIADVYDALRSRRAYKEPWSEEKVRQTIRDDAGKAFDPELVQIFDERYERIRAVWAAHPDDPPVTSSAPAPAP